MKYIFVHGNGQNSSSWKKTLSYLENQNNFICLDLLTLLKNRDFTYDNLYPAFFDYCNNTLEPINLCGLSLGGILSLNYALDFPKKVNSLILIGTYDKLSNFLFKIQICILKIIPKFIFENIGYKKKDFIQIIKSMLNLNFNANLKNIQCDTLIIRGIKDILNKRPAKILFDNIPNSKLSIIKKSGHLVNIDNPKELALEVFNFYKKWN
jgi:pimeloyl-ACP methyl ester carboxylesterase